MKRAIEILTIFLLVATVMSCSDRSSHGKRRHLSDTGKSVFFTDRRPFDRKLIDEDISRLSKAISENPKDARLWVARGFIHAALTDFKRAISDFEEAARLDPNTDTADPYGPKKSAVLYLLALAYWQNGQPAEAIKHFSIVIDRNPSHARSRFYRGMASLEAGNRANAIKDIEAALSLQKESMYEQVLGEIKGQGGQEAIFASYVICFHPNKPPQNRPFGYIWEIQHQVR